MFTRIHTPEYRTRTMCSILLVMVALTRRTGAHIEKEIGGCTMSGTNFCSVDEEPMFVSIPFNTTVLDRVTIYINIIKFQ